MLKNKRHLDAPQKLKNSKKIVIPKGNVFMSIIWSECERVFT